MVNYPSCRMGPTYFCGFADYFELFRESPPQAILEALRDETMNDPRDRIQIAQSHVYYRPSLLGQQP